MRRAAATAAAVLVAVATACDEPDAGPPEPPLVDFESAVIRVETETDTIRLNGEIAQTPSQRAYGLMERDSLPSNAGMIFVYGEEQPADSGYWMYRTRIPLDIAYLAEDGTILSILQMQPCTSPAPAWCETYPPGVPYFAALEVNLGWFARNGVEVGDRVVLESA